MTTETNKTPPSRLNFAREMFAATDMIGLPAAILTAPRKNAAPRRNHPVILLPGFGAHDVSMAPLGYFLKRHGFETKGWGLGVNTGGRGFITSLHELSDNWNIDRSRVHNGEGEVPALIDKVAETVTDASKRYGKKIHLAGWSLGGFVAREVARDLPNYVQSVVTMGAPVFGGPKYTSVAPLFKARNVDLDWVEMEIEKRFDTPIRQSITAIYSKRDGIVGWRAAYDDRSPKIEHHEVNVSHMGIGLNAKVWKLALNGLIAQDAPDA